VDFLFSMAALSLLEYDAPRRSPSMKKLNLALALASGLVGGLVSHYLIPQTVEAQSPAPPAKEIRAQSFVLVNESGSVLGKFTVDGGGKPAIRLFDARGREVWSAEGPAMRASTGR
jgi:hypothetical protein